MIHSVVIMKHRKVKKDGKHGYMITSRYNLTEDEICEQELEKFLEDVTDTDVWVYEASIEATTH